MIPVWVTEGIHPRVLAVSNTLGNLLGGRAATATNSPRQNIPAFADNVIAEDQDVRDGIWWNPKNGGTGTGYNINAILPIQPAPLVGMQAGMTRFVRFGRCRQARVAPRQPTLSSFSPPAGILRRVICASTWTDPVETDAWRAGHSSAQ